MLKKSPRAEARRHGEIFIGKGSYLRKMWPQRGPVNAYRDLQVLIPAVNVCYVDFLPVENSSKLGNPAFLPNSSSSLMS